MSKIIHLRQLRLMKDSKEIRVVKAAVSKLKSNIIDLESKLLVIEDRLCDEATEIDVTKFKLEEAKQVTEGQPS